jgi:hypothetical protein
MLILSAWRFARDVFVDALELRRQLYKRYPVLRNTE